MSEHADINAGRTDDPRPCALVAPRRRRAPLRVAGGAVMTTDDEKARLLALQESREYPWKVLEHAPPSSTTPRAALTLREMFALLRELYPEFEQGEITLTFTSAMTSALVFECDLAEKPLRVPVASSATPEHAFAQHVAARAQVLADQAAAEAARAEMAALSARAHATGLAERAAELMAALPREGVCP